MTWSKDADFKWFDDESDFIPTISALRVGWCEFDDVDVVWWIWGRKWIFMLMEKEAARLLNQGPSKMSSSWTGFLHMECLITRGSIPARWQTWGFLGVNHEQWKGDKTYWQQQPICVYIKEFQMKLWYHGTSQSSKKSGCVAIPPKKTSKHLSSSPPPLPRWWFSGHGSCLVQSHWWLRWGHAWLGRWKFSALGPEFDAESLQ